MSFKLIRINDLNHQHVSHDTVKEFEESIIELEDPEIITDLNGRRLFNIVNPFLAGCINSILPKTKSPIFIISMGVTDIKRSLPFALLSTENALYLFDAWPKYYKLIAKIVTAYNISRLFVTSKQTADNLSVLLKNTKVFWCPEGLKPSEYKPYQFFNKDIDIMQFGRKYDDWHNIVVDKLSALKISYYYEKINGDIIFKNRDDFINGLGRSKISICFPQSITNREISGNISTMTNRYLQSMASKCLLLGEAPEEMIQLFGYNPVIAVDMNDPVGQVARILRDYNDYHPLIEKNYLECISNHSWKNRWLKIKEIQYTK